MSRRISDLVGKFRARRREGGTGTGYEWFAPLRDAQARPPAGWCRGCGGELYGGEGEEDLCPACRAAEEN